MHIELRLYTCPRKGYEKGAREPRLVCSGQLTPVVELRGDDEWINIIHFDNGRFI